MKKLTYYVPVDFSECSLNALQYATMLARFAEGKVVLGHVIDLNEVPESENPVVVSWSLDRLTRKVNEKMKSLREIISLEGIVVEEEILVGNVQFNLLKQIEKVKPNVIVMGRNTERQPGKDSLLTFITKNTKVPVLVVPGSHNPKVPNKAVLATDMKSFDLREFEPFIEILKKTSQELSVLNIRGSQAKGKQISEWVDKFNAAYAMEVKVLPTQHDDTVENVVKYVNANNVDLLCTINRNYSLLEKLFSPAPAHQLTTHVEVPVLLIRE